MECARCGRRAEIEIKYAKEHLCRGCFISLFEGRVRKNIRINRLLRSDERTGVALSGGKDSAVALSVLRMLHSKAPKSELSALTIDQGIKGTEDGLKAAKALCRRLDVPHSVFSFKKEYGVTMDALMKRVRKLGDAAPACSFCGVLRRKLLNDKAQELGLTKVATGHNLDDETQACLMNFIRGEHDRLARLGPIVGVVRDPSFVPRIKPLRDCPEEEVLSYAKLKGIPYSAVKCPHSGEAFRGTVRAALALFEEKYPGTRFQVLKSSDQLITMLRERTNVGSVARCSVCGEPSSGRVCRACQLLEKLGLA
jgi:uncharacterized protein (TIGR00269 family)